MGPLLSHMYTKCDTQARRRMNECQFKAFRGRCTQTEHLNCVVDVPFQCSFATLWNTSIWKAWHTPLTKITILITSLIISPLFVNEGKHWAPNLTETSLSGSINCWGSSDRRWWASIAQCSLLLTAWGVWKVGRSLKRIHVCKWRKGGRKSLRRGVLLSLSLVRARTQHQRRTFSSYRRISRQRLKEMISVNSQEAYEQARLSKCQESLQFCFSV